MHAPEADKQDSATASHAHRIWTFAALLLLMVIAQSLYVSLRDGTPVDFASYWAAAKLAVAGNAADAYDMAIHRAVENQAVTMGDNFLPFAYPPSYLLLILPFGFLPFGSALCAWVGTTLAIYATAARKLMPGALALALAFPPALACGVVGQNGFLLAAIWIAATLLYPRRPFAAGAVLGLLALKPHLGILLPIAFIAVRDWRAFAGALIGAVMTVGIGLVLYGPSEWQGFFAMMPLYGSLTADGLIGWNKMASLYATLRQIGLPAGISGAIHIAVALAATTMLVRIWRGSHDPLLRMAILVTATALISPYLYVYDQVMLIVAIAWLCRAGIRPKHLVALYVIPLASLLLLLVPEARFNPAPLLPLALMALIWRSRHVPLNSDGQTHKERPE